MLNILRSCKITTQTACDIPLKHTQVSLLTCHSPSPHWLQLLGPEQGLDFYGWQGCLPTVRAAQSSAEL